MKGKRLLAALLTLSLTASLALTGCGESKKNDDNAAGGDNKEEAKMDDEQYINAWLTQEPKTLDQSKSSDLYSSIILTNINEALTRVETDENGKEIIKEAGAESWEKSEDGLKWTFKLRDMKWSDGQPVTAEQYVYGITRTLDPDVGSPYGFLLFPIKNAQAYNGGKGKLEDVGVKAIDDKTVEFTLENPCSYFLNLTYFKVMQPQRKDILEKYGDKYGTEAETMMSCGPFKMKEWVHNNKVELEKNPEYWDAENVKLEKATMKIIKETSSAMNELYNGSLDMANVSKPEWIKKFDDSGNFEVLKSYDGSSAYMFFNHKDQYFQNAKIRKAFMLATDREGMCETLYKKLAEPALAWCPPAVFIGDEEYRKKIEFNPVEELKKENPDAKALFIEGLKELGLDPDPSKHTITFLQAGTDATSKEFADFEQQNFQSVLGVNIKSEFCEWAVFQSREEQLDYQIASMGWTGDYNDPMTFFDMWMSTAGVVHNGWKNEKYDELIQKTTKTIDSEERAKLFAEAEKMLVYDEAVFSPTVYRFRNAYIRKHVKNATTKTFGVGIMDLKYLYTSGR
ncbi:peptide ABC transporter substrate-binding protein [Clostridium senegalense]|uniref:Peptide ABC transporter substrate-binding protein n=1 Tax=Clostridium senegalense TaxID=1465809 RepID=A0A6M0H7N8_9CLOT|nr:peptide ABC transporter substrate-binding protein [Clostridium senegalense]NEU06324.1 peptide ABC transporter substrate-binding protein [Clostridium senegalense]